MCSGDYAIEYVLQRATGRLQAIHSTPLTQDTALGELPEAGVAQSTDLIPAIDKGVLAGGVTD